MAAATILLRDGENRAVFSNSIAARLADFGTAWTRVRVGILMQLSGAGNFTTPNIALGFCSGTTNVYGDATTTHFVGVRSGDTWTDTGGGLVFITNTILPTKRVGVTTTDGADLVPINLQSYGAVAASTKRTMWFVDLTKGSPNYTINMFYRNGNGSATLPSESDFLAQMEVLVPTFTQHTNAAPQTLAVDEGVDGVLDAFNMYWSPSSHTVEVSAVAVAILA